MARKKVKNEEKTEVKKNPFKLRDSYGSLVVGFVVVAVVIGVLIATFRGEKKVEDTSSIQDETTAEEKAEGIEIDEAGQKVYTVKAGEDLWRIAENIYEDGYKWVEIVKANNITNPNIIKEGQKLVIPDIETVEKDEEKETSSEETETQEESIEKEITLTPTETPSPTEEPEESETEPELEQEEIEVEAEKITDDEYKVQKGDYLWDIAVRAYGDGYKWVEIASANKLDNPDIIHSGNNLAIPR